MLALVVLTTYALLVRRRPLLDSYTKIFTLEWIVLLSVYQIYQNEFVPLSDHFSVLFLAFFLPFVLADFYWERTIHYIPEIRFPAVIPANLYLILAACAAFLSIALAAIIVRSAGIASLMGLRELFVGIDGAGPISIGTGVSFPLACGGWYLSRVMKKKRGIMLFGIMTIVLAVLTTSKVFLFIALIFALPIDAEGKPLITPRVFFVISIIAVAVFALLHIVLGKIAGVPSEQSLVEGIIATIRVYLLGAIAGLQLVIDGSFAYPHNHMWKFIADVFPGLVDAPNTLILPWSSIGIWETNVYSAFASWYEAVGTFGISIIGFFLGSLYSFIFRSCSNLPFLRVFSIFPLIFIFHQDFFFESIRIWIGFSLVAMLIAMTYKFSASHLNSNGQSEESGVA